MATPSLLDRWMLPQFLAVFGAIYAAGHLLVFRSWSAKLRPDAASCLISLAHGTPAVFLALAAIAAAPLRTFDAPNTPFQNLALDYSIAYFIADQLHLFLFAPGEVLFIAHHFATLFVFVTCRYVARHGAFALLVLLVIAEVTSAFQNAWTLTGMRRADSPAAARMYKLMSPPFYAFYTVMRALVGPFFFLRMSLFYLSADARPTTIPRLMRFSWIIVVGTAIAVSIMWVWNHWMVWFKERSEDAAKRGT